MYFLVYTNFDITSVNARVYFESIIKLILWRFLHL
jgi:hypothetical protein